MKRRLPLIFVAIVTVICLVAASVAAVASGANVGAVAFSVNGTKVSQATFDRELAELADHAATMKAVLGTPISSTPGAVGAQAATAWLNIRISLELLRQEAARRNVTLTAADRQTAEQTLTADLQSANLELGQLPPSVRTALIDYFAYRDVLQLTDANTYRTFLSAAARKSHIKVDPRYSHAGG